MIKTKKEMNNINATLKEAKRLWDMNWGVHWLHEKSKRPLESGWTSGERKSWKYLSETYVDGLNLGVRLGEASRVDGKGYLAVVDIDVKSTLPHHKKEALRAAKKILGSAVCPRVDSGRGNGSRHYYFLTAKPFKTWNPAQSTEVVKVAMPSKKPSRKEVASLTAEELTAGLRLAPAWEVSLYSEGRQVVLPPSIHPDSGKPYIWATPCNEISDLPLIEIEKPSEAALGKNKSTIDSSSKSKKSVNHSASPKELEGVVLEDVDISWLPNLNEKIREGILHGTGVTDRSSYLLIAARGLLDAGLTRDEILSVLTDNTTFLGCCALERRSGNRNSAALWVWDYTLKEIIETYIPKRSAREVFSAPIDDVRILSENEMAIQTTEFTSGRTWQDGLIYNGKKGEGTLRGSINNIVLILMNAVSENIVKRNEFAFRDTYGVDTPWGGKKDALITDDDVTEIKFWFEDEYGTELRNQNVEEALVIIARKNAFDPVIDIIDALPEWDGRPRLDTWLEKYFEADIPENDEAAKEYYAQVFRKWMVAMIMRARSPGVKFDWMPIFEGVQGIGKSSFGRLLVGDKFFLDWLPNLADKDSALMLQGMWGVEMGELANLRRSQIEDVKSYISRTVDKVRPPYGRRMIECPRRCVFFGTTNREKYLMDETGNRRFKPLKVGKLHFKALARDREQLFAEARHLVDEKIERPRTLELTNLAKEYEAKMHVEKMVDDDSSVMFEYLQDFFKRAEKNEEIFNLKRFRIHELFVGGGPLTNWKDGNRNSQFAAKALKKLGAESRYIKGRKFWKIDFLIKTVPPPPPEDFC